MIVFLKYYKNNIILLIQKLERLLRQKNKKLPFFFHL